LLHQELLDGPPMISGRNITVIGSGYVGLTLAACLGHFGHTVICTDVSTERIDRLTQGEVPIVEEGLPELVRGMMSSGRLSFGTDNAQAVSDAEFVFLCLPTPEGADGQADLSFVKTVATEIGPHLRPGAVLINKSTVPVGTARLVEMVLGRDDVDVASNPEFLAEGSALRDSLQPDRIVIGAKTPEVARRVAELYGIAPSSRMGAIADPVVPNRFVLTDILSAELIKYASNAYLATRLTFVNSMAEMCDAVGADIHAVVAGMGADHRIGSAFLRPGPGWGGSCFPKDTQALVHTAELFGCNLALVKTAIEMNAEHTQRIVQKVLNAIEGIPTDSCVAIWGLTFKAGTNDLRSSPALEIAMALGKAGVTVQAFDPTVGVPIDGIDVRMSMADACEGADVLLITTEWADFASADLAAIGGVMRRKAVVDARNILNADVATAAGFDYVGVGLGHLITDSELAA
jgi:UDPglucose 6-dehydrogenase